MKKFINNKLFYFMLMVFSGCTDSLLEEPRSIVAPDQYFNSVQEDEASITGVYAYLYANYGEAFYSIALAGTDLASFKFPIALPTQHVDYTLSLASPGNYMPSYWVNLYRGIGTANLAISRVSSSDINMETKDRLIGEAKFLRALYYLNLSRIWGGVPLWTEELDVGEVSVLPRATLEEVHDQIVEDLTSAINQLPASYTSEDLGRVTRGAAQALLAKVYLYMKDWSKAADVAQQVINSDQYRLLANYSDVFDINNEFNEEVIFSVQYKQDYRPTYRHSWYEPSSSEGIAEFNGYGIFRPTNWFVESFEANDKRYNSIIIKEWNGQMLSRPYFGPKFLDLTAPPRNSGGNFIVLRYADVLLMLAEAENELLGPTPQAYDALNEVRERAGIDPLSGLTKDQLREAIHLERAHELAGEGERRWDLNRWGNLVESVKKVEEDNPIGAKNVQPYHILFPIPPAEIIKNPSLTQNPGYGG